MGLLINLLRVEQFVQTISFEEIFSLKMYDSGLYRGVLSDEVLQVIVRPGEANTPRRSRWVQMFWSTISRGVHKPQYTTPCVA